MNFKRIIASIIAICVISTSAYAFTPYGSSESTPSEDSSQTSGEESTENEQESTKEDFYQNFINKFSKNDYRYDMFMQIIDAYVENHLYEFTREDVINKFFKDFLESNPDYFELFADYILGTMDPYSGYHSSSSGFLDSGSNTLGFGFMLKDSDEGVYVSSVIEDSNANDVGFLAGDRFVSIAGINVEKLTFDVVSTILSKPQKFVNVESDEESDSSEKKSVPVEIVVDRNGEKVTLIISKGPMTISTINSYVTDNDGKKTGYISISNFLGEDMDKEFESLIKKYAEDGIRHLTIDLRDNGGGSLDYALSMAENFLDKDELICYYYDRKLDEPEPVYSTTDKISFDSISILINENTASAAELFTSILVDKKLAKTVGTTSYGKSLGQSVFSLANGDYITITTYQMLNTSLESYNGIGIKPDIAIEDVEMYYELPALLPFNHKNFSQIKEGEYSDATKALEDRLVIMGVLREEFADGIFDEKTKNSLYVFQTDHEIEATGYVNYETVSKITKIINNYKTSTYYDDTQYDVAMKIHHSFSQGKRLASEKEKLRKEQNALIEARNDKLDNENTNESEEK